MPLPAPFLLERITVPKPWGGRALTKVPGIELPPGVDVGETWELHDRPEGSSRMRGTSTTLADLMRADAVALVGAGVPLGHGGRFPLLLKFLDAREELSVQVHPDDAQARADGDSGKNECSIVLAAGPQARILRGFKPGVTRNEFAAKIASPQVVDLLAAFRPRVDDIVHIPPGTVHAIGPDVVLFEVQQNSDLTYRIHDFGRGREVHHDQALRVAKVEAPPGGNQTVQPKPLADGGIQVIATPQFRVRRYSLRDPREFATSGRYLTITVFAGAGALAWTDTDTGARAALAMKPGDTALVPGCLAKVAIAPHESMNIVLCDPGDR
jgi:mannose-6-phosphate isomerase